MVRVDSPIRGCLPRGIKHSVEHVEEHGANITAVTPVQMPLLVVYIRYNISTRVGSLEIVSTTPNNEGEDEERHNTGLSTYGAGEAFAVESEAEDSGANDLGGPVENRIEGSSTNVEPGGIDILEMVGIEPVGGEEEWEEEDDVPVGLECFEHADELGLPRWIFHKNDTRPVFALDVMGIAEKGGEDESSCHEDDEGNVSSVVDSATPIVNVLGQLMQSQQTRLDPGLVELTGMRAPMTAPKLKIIQNQEMKRPFCPSVG